MAKRKKIAYIDIKGIKTRSAKRYLPKGVLPAHKFSFGRLYYYGAEHWFIPKRGYKVFAGLK